MSRVTKKKIDVVDRTRGSKEWDKTNKDLISIQNEIIKHGKQIGESFYKLGKLYNEVRKEELWKFAKREYKNFTEWCEIETGFTRQTVYNLMSVSNNLDLKQAIKLGPTLSYAISKVKDSECKEELIQMAYQGARVVDIKEAIKKYNSPNINNAQSTPLAKIKGKLPVSKTTSGVTKINGSGEVRQVEFDTKKLEKIQSSKGKTAIKKVKEDKFTGTIEISGKQVAIEINTKDLEIKFWLR